MKTHWLQRAFSVGFTCAALLCLPSLALAVDTDLDGIDDGEEVAGVTFNGYTYAACTGTPAAGTPRNSCVSPQSKDIFVYLVTEPNGFLQRYGLVSGTNPADVSVLFKFLTGPIDPIITTTLTGKVLALNVGVHVAVVNTKPANRAVGNLGQKAVVMVVDEALEAWAFGSTTQGTPSDTGESTIWPAYIKDYLTRYVFGGVDVPSVWTAYIQQTAAHELSHAAALTANYDSKLRQYHYASGNGTVMDDKMVCSSRRGGSCNIYNVYASGDNPCLLSVAPVTNPLRCGPLPTGGTID